jgi:hypothetical protein
MKIIIAYALLILAIAGCSSSPTGSQSTYVISCVMNQGCPLRPATIYVDGVRVNRETTFISYATTVDAGGTKTIKVVSEDGWTFERKYERVVRDMREPVACH